jgi:ribosomal protein L22
MFAKISREGYRKMTAQDPQTSKQNRQKALQATKDAMTKAKKIQHTFIAGKKPAAELKSPGEAIRAASVLYRGLQDAMTEKGLDPQDVRVAICFCDTGLTLAVMQRFIPGPEGEKAIAESLASQPAIMLGLVFGIVDREEDAAGNVVWAGMKEFLSTKQVVGWLDGLVTQLTDGWN